MLRFQPFKKLTSFRNTSRYLNIFKYLAKKVFMLMSSLETLTNFMVSVISPTLETITNYKD